MARLTWTQLKAEALLELRNRSDISTRLETWIREAYQEVFYGFRFYETEKAATFNLGSGQSEKTFASLSITDLKHIFSLRDTTNGRKVRKANFRWIDERATGSGAPTHYCRFSDSILFDSAPTATTAYKLRYRKQITEPVFSGSTYPETPSEWDEVIRLKAVVRGFRALLEPDQADSKDSEAIRLIAMFPTDEDIDAEDDDFGLIPKRSM